MLETAPELAHRVWMGLGFAGPLHDRAIGKQHEWTNHFIAPLRLIDEAQLQLCEIRRRVDFIPHWSKGNFGELCGEA